LETGAGGGGEWSSESGRVEEDRKENGVGEEVKRGGVKRDNERSGL
jgi:hypothetical protein